MVRLCGVVEGRKEKKEKIGEMCKNRGRENRLRKFGLAFPIL